MSIIKVTSVVYRRSCFIITYSRLRIGNVWTEYEEVTDPLLHRGQRSEVKVKVKRR